MATKEWLLIGGPADGKILVVLHDAQVKRFCDGKIWEYNRCFYLYNGKTYAIGFVDANDLLPSKIERMIEETGVQEMSLTQERINEIMLECWHEIAKQGKGMNPILLGNLFLCRLREEQEPSGYFRDGWNGREEVSEIHKDEEGVTPLFTIPPATPDCKELVEALEKLENMKCDYSSPEVFDHSMHDLVKQALAKHNARMGEE